MFGTSAITLTHVDLNLLVALDALVEHRSVARAAEQLHLTPPAVSRTLGRLRAATGDDVLVRDGRTMTPTPRALALQEEVQDLVRRAAAVLTPVRALELDALRRHFTVRGNEDLLALLAPGLVRRVAAAAPGVDLRLLVEDTVDADDLTRGRADIELSGDEPSSPAIRSQVVGHDELVVAVAVGHPLTTVDVFDARAFAGADHVSVSRRGRLHGPLDEKLATSGLRRRVVAAVPSTAVALEVVRATDAVAVVPRRLAYDADGVVALSVPLSTPALPVVVSWHRRHDSDPAHAWLREMAMSLLTDVLA